MLSNASVLAWPKGAVARWNVRGSIFDDQAKAPATVINIALC